MSADCSAVFFTWSAPPCPAFSSMRRYATFGGVAPLFWTAATNLRACIGSTRSSWSDESMSSGGYFWPSFTWWYGE